LERQYLAYFLIFLMVAAVAGLIAYGRHHSQTNTYRRLKMREHEAYKKRQADKTADNDEA